MYNFQLAAESSKNFSREKRVHSRLSSIPLSGKGKHFLFGKYYSLSLKKTCREGRDAYPRMTRYEIHDAETQSTAEDSD